MSGHCHQQDVSIHQGLFSDVLKLVSFDVSKLRSHDFQVGHGLWGLLGSQVLGQLVEVAHDFPHKILGHLQEKQQK